MKASISTAVKSALPPVNEVGSEGVPVFPREPVGCLKFVPQSRLTREATTGFMAQPDFSRRCSSIVQWPELEIGSIIRFFRQQLVERVARFVLARRLRADIPCLVQKKVYFESHGP